MDDVTRRAVLDAAQGDLPLEARALDGWARETGLQAEDLAGALADLCADGAIRRFGGVFDSRAMGWTTTLVGAQVDPERLEAILERLQRHEGVTHAYVRDHAVNLWFTVAAREKADIAGLLEALKEEGLTARAWSMPARRVFKLKVRFEA